MVLLACKETLFDQHPIPIFASAVGKLSCVTWAETTSTTQNAVSYALRCYGSVGETGEDVLDV